MKKLTPAKFATPVSEEPVVFNSVETFSILSDEWVLRAARGECSWICTRCLYSFEYGMPDACACGEAACTTYIRETKERAAQ